MEEAQYWSKSFTLRSSPPFLEPVKHQLLMIGKSLNLIQHVERGVIHNYDDFDYDLERPSLASALLESVSSC